MNLFKISIISSLFLHCVVFFLLKNLDISVEENENLDLQIVSQIITRNGELYDDFLLDKNERILNVINAPSPAATSSFAIAREIINQLEK